MKKPMQTMLIMLFSISLGHAQEPDDKKEPVWNVKHHESGASFRGVHVDANGEDVWISGSKGTILRSDNGGETWQDVSPPDAEQFDFRDVHGFPGGEHAVALAVGSPGRIYRASDFGRKWEVAYEDTRPEIFLDALDFWDDTHGIAFGDPINGKIVVLRTNDGGKTWKEPDVGRLPDAIEGEGGFAASGTCICTLGDDAVLIGLGGARKEGDPPNARILMSPDRGGNWLAVPTPMKSGAASGIFSMAFADDQNGVAVGGTYDKPEDATNNICITSDGGETWVRPESTPRGYRSCVVVLNQIRYGNPPRMIAAGKTGTDYSGDMGKTWKPLDDQGFYAVDSAAGGGTVIAVGPAGQIGVLPVQELQLDW